MTLLLATSNRGKMMEIGEVLAAGLPLKLLSLEDLPELPSAPEETGVSFVENALLKARFYHQHSGLPALADDSGIVVEALKGELGVHTRRWGAGPLASDEEWIAYFLERMRHKQEKRATFMCALAFVDGAREKLFEGRCEGVITKTLEAEYLPGLPVSGCFRPNGCRQVFSALSLEEKNRVSHRGKATAKLRKFLETME